MGADGAAARGAGRVAGVDIGGTKIAVALARGGRIAARAIAPAVRSGDADAIGRQVLDLIESACRSAGWSCDSIDAVGVSSCGPFVMRDAMIELAAPNLCGGLAGRERGLPNDWTAIPLERVLRERYANVRIENDCVAALVAERRHGALAGCENCAYVTWSTGIGFGLCVDGRVLRGRNGNAGHAGHQFVCEGEDALCGCGNRGDLEALVAGNALERRHGRPPEKLFAAAAAGNADAAAAVGQAARRLARAIYNVIVTLDLQKVSIGGSLFLRNRELLLPLMQAEIAPLCAPVAHGCELVAAGLGESLGEAAALWLVS